MPTAAFAARTTRLRVVSGLRSGLSLHRLLEISEGLGAARLVSTPSRRVPGAGLGSGLPLQVSPNLGSSAPPVSRRALKLTQVRCVCHSATPAWLPVLRYENAFTYARCASLL